MTVYSSVTESPVYNVFCASSDWSLWQLTRDISTSNHYPLPQTPSIPSTTTSTAAPTSASSTGKSSSKAWIAGPVVGGVFAVALLVALGFFLYRKRQRSKEQLANNARFSGSTANEEYYKYMSPYSQQTQFSHQSSPQFNPHFSSSQFTPQPSFYPGEMDASRQPRSELPAQH